MSPTKPKMDCDGDSMPLGGSPAFIGKFCPFLVLLAVFHSLLETDSSVLGCSSEVVNMRCISGKRQDPGRFCMCTTTNTCLDVASCSKKGHQASFRLVGRVLNHTFMYL